MGLVVQRVAGLLVPDQVVVAQRSRVGERGAQVEAPVGVDGEPGALRQYVEHRLDPLQVGGEGRAADLHLHVAVAHLEVLPHLVGQLGLVVRAAVVAARGVDRDRLALRGAGPEAVAQRAVQRLTGRLGREVPHRHVQRPDRDRPVAVTAGLLVAHHHVGDRDRVDQAGVGVEELRLRIRVEPGQQPPGEQLGLGVAAVGVEAVADNRLTVDDGVAGDRHHRHRHLGEVDDGVADAGVERDLGDSDVGDAHACGSPVLSSQGWVPGGAVDSRTTSSAGRRTSPTRSWSGPINPDTASVTTRAISR